MLHKRSFLLKWISIITAYTCIFLLSFDLGARTRKYYRTEPMGIEPRHLRTKRLFHDHAEYISSSTILEMIDKELKTLLPFEDDHTSKNHTSLIRHGLVVFYDFSYHHILFQEFLWLFSSWMQLRQNARIQNDLILFISLPIIPYDFKKLQNATKTLRRKNKLIIYPCMTLLDSLLDKTNDTLPDFSLNFQMELVRLFFWQQTRLSSLLLFLNDEYKQRLLKYDYIFRLDLDSFLMPNFRFYQQTSSLILGEALSNDEYTLNRLQRIHKYFHSNSTSQIVKEFITISWFGKLHLLSKLTQQIILMATWLMKEEFTESERLHHLTYLNYPSWYVDGVFEYATAVILTINQFENFHRKVVAQFDCHHLLLTDCLHLSFRDPSHYLHLSKHLFHQLTYLNQDNLTTNELYIYQTVIKTNEVFDLYFS